MNSMPALFGLWCAELGKNRVCKGRVGVEKSGKDKQEMTREEWLAWFEQRSMDEVVADLDAFINSDEFRAEYRKRLEEIGAIPKEGE